MVTYEMGVVVRADLPEDGFAVEMDKVKALIDRFGGTIDKMDEWGRRRLAYPIQKQTEGMYTFITYTADPSAPREIESRMRLIENVLRFLTVRKDEVQAAAEVLAPPAQAPVEVPVEAPAAAPVEAVEAPVETVEVPVESVEAPTEPVEAAEPVEAPVEAPAEPAKEPAEPVEAPVQESEAQDE